MIKSWLVFLIVLSSCGKSIKDDVGESTRELEIVDGSYRAFLAPINRRLSATISGEAKVLKYGDDFRVSSRIRNAPDKKFVQYLHTGSYCPGLEDDLNGDGHLDRFEFMGKAGQVILPLDGDLSSQELGRSFPLRRNFLYQRSTSYYLMLFDLHLPDELLNDHIVKLKDEHLQLDNKVVAIFVQRAPELPAEISREVPVACGVLKYESTGPSESDEWQSDESRDDDIRFPRRPTPRPPRPSPPQRPRPRPPNPQDDQYERRPPPSSWWGRVRQRWRRWRYGERPTASW